MRRALPHLLERHAVNPTQQIDAMGWVAELSHDTGHHERSLVDDNRWRSKLFQCRAQSPDIRPGRPVQEVDVARGPYHTMKGKRVAAYQHVVDIVLIEADNEIKEIDVQDIVPLASHVFLPNASPTPVSRPSTWRTRASRSAIRQTSARHEIGLSQAGHPLS